MNVGSIPVAGPSGATGVARAHGARASGVPSPDGAGRRGLRGEELSADERREVARLQKRDREVRAHEQAHRAAGGQLVRGGIRYEYETGPDGKRYVVGGEVSIDTSPGKTPEETIAKAQQIRRAALAPADPSPTDRRVAAKASRMEAKARAELLREKSEEARANEGGMSAGAALPEPGDARPRRAIEAYAAGDALGAASLAPRADALSAPRGRDLSALA